MTLLWILCSVLLPPPEVELWSWEQGRSPWEVPRVLPWPSPTGHVSCPAAWVMAKCPHSVFRTLHCGSAKLGIDLSLQLHLSVNKQRICSLSCTGTERLMFARLSATSWDAALPQFCPNNDFQIKPTIRLLMRASQSSQPYCIYELSNAALASSF